MTEEREESETSEGSRLFDVDGLSRYLSISRATVYTWCSVGRIPGVVRLGRALRFDKGEIDLWIESRKSAAQMRTGE